MKFKTSTNHKQYKQMTKAENTNHVLHGVSELCHAIEALALANKENLDQPAHL